MEARIMSTNEGFLRILKKIEKLLKEEKYDELKSQIFTEKMKLNLNEDKASDYIDELIKNLK